MADVAGDLDAFAVGGADRFEGDAAEGGAEAAVLHRASLGHALPGLDGGDKQSGDAKEKAARMNET
jgi:hypothetical protein